MDTTPTRTPGMLIPELLAARVASHPDREALRFDTEALTWTELRDRVARASGALRAAGVAPGDRVALLDLNHAAWVELFLACAQIGAVLVPINCRLVAAEVEYIVNDCGVKVLFVGNEFTSILATIWDRATSVRRVVVIGGPDDGYGAWLNIARDFDVHPAVPNTTVLQLYTSGTTGFPKGALLTHGGLVGNARALGGFMGFRANDSALVSAPLFHVAAVSLFAVQLYLGGRTVIVRESEPMTICGVLARQRITHTFLLPELLDRIVREPKARDFNYSALRVLFYGSTPMPVPTLRAGMAMFPNTLVQMYGMTEASGPVSLLDQSEHADAGTAHRLCSAGTVFGDTRVEIREPLCQTPLPAGSTGEVWVHSPYLMSGYWNLPKATEEAFDDAGWCRTGDAGHLDTDGYLYITDRIKDMIVSGGENLYPADIERVLAEHPSVADVAVVGVPDDPWGEVPKAIVVAAPDRAVDEAELLAHCHRNLTAQQCPRSVDVVDALPRNATGKVLKRDLRATHWFGREHQLI